MTTRALAERAGVSVELMREILEESQAAGVVEPSPAGWRLSPAAEREFGEALRSLDLPADDSSRPARHAGTRDLRPAA